MVGSDKAPYVDPRDPFIPPIVSGALSDDEAIAARSDGPLLITASSLEAVGMLARRVHAASTRRSTPLISIGARVLPCEADHLGAMCTDLQQAAAAGGGLLITGVEELSPMVQGLLIEMLAEMTPRRS